MKVKIIIAGYPLKTIDAEPGETISQLSARLNSGTFPIGKVQSWHADSKVVSDPNNFEVKDGMMLAGTPKVDGGC